MEYMAAQMDRQIEGAKLAYDAAIEDGLQPAFPVADYDHQTFQPATVDESKRQLSGMTLRDYFAAKAMQALITNAGSDTSLRSQVAAHAYGFADDMLASRAFSHPA